MKHKTYKFKKLCVSIATADPLPNGPHWFFVAADKRKNRMLIALFMDQRAGLKNYTFCLGKYLIRFDYIYDKAVVLAELKLESDYE